MQAGFPGWPVIALPQATPLFIRGLFEAAPPPVLTFLLYLLEVKHPNKEKTSRPTWSRKVASLHHPLSIVGIWHPGTSRSPGFSSSLAHAFPDLRAQWLLKLVGLLPVTVAGPRQNRTDFPSLPPGSLTRSLVGVLSYGYFYYTGTSLK